MNQIDNLQALHQMTPEEYPVLYKALHNYNGALLHRLEQLHEVAREHAESKWVFASVDYLIARFGGSASTWQSNKAYLSDIGLIRTRKPGSKTLSSALQESKKRAGKGRKAVSWYHIPDYTPERLKSRQRVKQSDSRPKESTARG